MIRATAALLALIAAATACSGANDDAADTRCPTATVRDSAGAETAMHAVGGRSCDGTIVEGLGLTPGVWWGSPRAIVGDGALEVSLSNPSGPVRIAYARGTWDGARVHTPAFRDRGRGRYEIAPPPEPGCWVLAIDAPPPGFVVPVHRQPYGGPCPESR